MCSIDEQGLVPKSRLYVHLSADTETAKRVGMRHGKPVIYQLDAAKMNTMIHVRGKIIKTTMFSKMRSTIRLRGI